MSLAGQKLYRTAIFGGEYVTVSTLMLMSMSGAGQTLNRTSIFGDGSEWICHGEQVNVNVDIFGAGQTLYRTAMFGGGWGLWGQLANMMLWAVLTDKYVPFIHSLYGQVSVCQKSSQFLEKCKNPICFNFKWFSSEFSCKRFPRKCKSILYHPYRSNRSSSFAPASSSLPQ